MAEQWDMLTSSQEGILASHSVLPGSDEARQMTVTSGRNLFGLYEKSGLLGPCSKMLLGASIWASTMCWLTWKEKTTPGRRLLFQLVPSAPRTGETEYGLWHTPTAHMSKEGAYPAEFTRNTPTLAAEVQIRKFWPTPNAGDDRDRGNMSNPSIQRRAKLGKQLNLSMVVSEESGALNPEWVEWLMGYPIGHTDLEDSETPSSRKSQK
jgi:hypothetical protein